MIRLVGAILTIGAFSAVGVKLSIMLKKRSDAISGMIACMELIKSEIAFKLSSIAEIMDKMKAQAPYQLRPFFAAVSNDLHGQGGENFCDIWNGNMDKLIWFNDEDKRIASEAAVFMGKYDAEEQSNMIGYIVRRLESRLVRAEEERRTKSRLYRALGTGIGVIAVLLVI